MFADGRLRLAPETERCRETVDRHAEHREQRRGDGNGRNRAGRRVGQTAAGVHRGDQGRIDESAQHRKYLPQAAGNRLTPGRKDDERPVTERRPFADAVRLVFSAGGGRRLLGHCLCHVRAFTFAPSAWAPCRCTGRRFADRSLGQQVIADDCQRTGGRSRAFCAADIERRDRF